MSDPNGHKRCPCVKTSDGVSLPVVSVFCDVQVNAVVATVRVVSVYRNPSQSPVSGVYTASNSFGEATVTSCDVSFAGRRFVTAVIDPSEVAVENTDGKFQNMLHFLMPFHGLPGYSDMSVELTYIQQLSFAPQGYYEIEVPLMVPPDVQIPAGVNSSILCTLDVGSVNCVWEVPTHRMAVVSQSGSYCCLQSTDSRANNVFHLKLNVLSSSIACSCVAQPNEPSSALPGGSFMTFISPPEAQYLPSDRIGRNMACRIM